MKSHPAACRPGGGATYPIALPPDIGDVNLMLSRSFQDTYDIDSIQPQPVMRTRTTVPCGSLTGSNAVSHIPG